MKQVRNLHEMERKEGRGEIITGVVAVLGWAGIAWSAWTYGSVLLWILTILGVPGLAMSGVYMVILGAGRIYYNREPDRSAKPVKPQVGHRSELGTNLGTKPRESVENHS